MNVNVKFDCTPEEARAFLGLPDVSQLNEALVQRMSGFMSGATTVDQLRDLASQMAPMGMLGMQMFQNMMEVGTRAAMRKGGGD